MKRILILIILFLLLCTQAYGATYTINASTVTMTAGFTPGGTLAAGDVLLVDSEDWTGESILFYNVQVTGGVVTVKNESGKIVTIDTDTAVHEAGIFISNCRNLTIDGTNGLTQGTQWGFDIGGASIHFGVRLYFIDDIIIKGLYLHDTVHNGMQFQHGVTNDQCPVAPGDHPDTPSGDDVNTNIEICYNKLTRCRMGMYIGTSSDTCTGVWDYGNLLDNVLIHHNKFYDMEYRAAQSGRVQDENDDGVCGKFYENYIETTNTDVAASWWGIGFHASGYTEYYEIYNNIFDMRSSGNSYSVLLGDSRHFDAPENEFYIHDNVVWDAPANGQAIYCKSDNVNNKVVNNTVVNTNSSTGYGIYMTAAGSALYNLIAGAGGNADNIYGPTATLADNIESTNISGQNFTNAATGNFSLTTDSPAKDAGTGAGYSGLDILGTVRPQGGVPDIGAYEFIPSEGGGEASCDIVTDYTEQDYHIHFTRYASSYYRGAITGRAYTDICKVVLMLTAFNGDISGKTFRVSKFTLTGNNLNAETTIAEVTGNNSWSQSVVEFDSSAAPVSVASGDAIVIYCTDGVDLDNSATVFYHTTTDSTTDFGIPRRWTDAKVYNDEFGAELYIAIYENYYKRRIIIVN